MIDDLDAAVLDALDRKMKWSEIKQDSLYYPLIEQDKVYGYTSKEGLNAGKKRYLDAAVEHSPLAQAIIEKQQISTSDE